MKIIFLVLFTLLVNLNASAIDFSKNSMSILQESELYIDKENLDLNQIKNFAVFHKTQTQHVNLGFVKDTTLWVKFTFYNQLDISVKKILEIQNPLLESVILYDANSVIKKGLLHLNSAHKSINPAFELSLKAGEIKTYYLQVQSTTTALRLGIYLKDEIMFIHDDHSQQLIIFIFFSVLIMLFIYNILIFLYSKERAYLYYCLYLLTLIFQQATYLGMTQIYLPPWFIHYDNLSVVLKVNIMYISAAIFAQSFLLSKKHPLIDKIYNIIIIAALVEIPLFGTPLFYYPEIAILTGFVFVIFNMIAGVYIYKQGYTQARFFVAGWSFLAVGFSLMILDGLGVISVMQNLTNMILLLTAIEAMVLSLAFTDRYMILKLAKEKSDAALVEILKERQKIIEFEIEKQTKELNTALESKKILLKELHHRTKNNLQLILSLVRMQSDYVNEELKEYSKNLENRINAIARTHQMLYLKDNLHQIDMREYINELCLDLENLSDKDIVIDTDVNNIHMPLREASYVGLVINELVTNSIKYVNKQTIEITIKLFVNQNSFKLEVSDNGDEFTSSCSDKGIGMKLVETLVEEQLNGSLKVNNEEGLHYKIRFKL